MSVEYVMPENCQIVGLAEIYKRYFGDNTNRTFIDVGAFDGCQYSNVWGLVGIGWKGVCIEPNPINFKTLVNTYRNCSQVLCVYAAIGREGTTRISLNNSVSTTSGEQIKWYQKHGWIGRNVAFENVNSIPLNSVFEQIEASPKSVDVLSIDTEGTELDILKEFDIDKWLPEMVIVEAHENHPLKGLGRFADDINKYFDSCGYTKIYCDVINNIYVLEVR